MPHPTPTKLRRFFVIPDGRAIPADDYETAHALFQIYCGWLEYRVVEPSTPTSHEDTKFTRGAVVATRGGVVAHTKKEQNHGSHQRNH